ncbi:BapA/Bap/LapF family prefix-like domain-containing protein, partial [Phocoenobacter skyensis]
ATKYIVLPFNRQEITFTNRNGDDLLVKLSSGEVVRVKDFFDMPRHLLLNPEQGKYIQLLDINDVSGSILSTKTLTSSEASALLGNDLHMLSSQASSDVLLSDGLYKGVAETSAMTTDDAISGAALGLGIFGAAVGIASTTGVFNSDSDNDSANSTETVTNPDGSSTTTTKTDTDGDGVADTTTVIEKDPSGKTTKETVTVDK